MPVRIFTVRTAQPTLENTLNLLALTLTLIVPGEKSVFYAI